MKTATRSRRRSHAGAQASEPTVAHNPPLVGAGPCAARRQAKAEAARLNNHYGGPGFRVTDRNGDVIEAPHAYFAERASRREWYVVLKEMPSTRIAPLTSVDLR
jgi:hypothetical protein